MQLWTLNLRLYGRKINRKYTEDNFFLQKQKETVMWIRKMGLGIFIGIILCSVVVNAGERERRRTEPSSAIEKMYGVPRRIYGRKKSRNKIRRMPGKFKLPPDARIGDIIKTKKGYKQIVNIWGNGQFRLKSLERKYHRKGRIRVKKRYN